MRTEKAATTVAAAPAMTVQQIRDPRDRRRVAYWRWSCNGRVLGATARNGDGTWRSLIYRTDPVTGHRNTKLPNSPTRRAAEALVRTWAIENPDRIEERLQ